MNQQETKDAPVKYAIPTPNMADHMETLRQYATWADFIIEVGPGVGTGSTLAFSAVMDERGCSSPAYVSVDIADHLIPWLRPSPRYWRQVIGDSRDATTVAAVKAILAPPELEAEWNGSEKLVFIDTVHAGDQLRRELEIWADIGAPELTTWLFHDTYMYGNKNVGMHQALDAFALKYGYVKRDLSTQCHGLTLVSVQC